VEEQTGLQTLSNEELKYSDDLLIRVIIMLESLKLELIPILP